MAEIKPPIDSIDEVISWAVPEYDKRERSKRWYIISSIAALSILVYSVWTGNFLFVVIIVLSALVIITNDFRQPDIINFSIGDEGLILGKKFIDYSELKNFSIIYKPRQDVKQLYFEFNNIFRPQLSIYLGNINPLKIRDILLNYLQEDLERENEPLSEQLGKLFKI
ncbi:hypothetical protein COT99_02385 [Candidatus Falkowbacteria bacterium CG10_big_fil_rev_8_21_14_0_10_43_10]|uniref:DUF5673 domain-containing protein n=1 Tax=Candidatus Falkowbacteria bacterium CG10_big_fil_rev_8_21_14_0_10_43_10 TaxID=1974567 RepID=A0A2H0V250_9BACT|nr:MAG: hypothetical protein COT99_02385 [Candidatus Falkowbacteria bacterium CG10_big_fil_rev_8_21_14_0_10_43_10]